MSAKLVDEQPAENKPRNWKRYAIPALVGGFALGIFLLTLAPTVTAEDSGELASAAWHFGVPHPPGYPLWTILCGLFSHAVPVGSVVYRTNLFSAVCSAGAAVLTYAAIRELKITPAIAASGALVWVFAKWSWTQSVITEVYGLNSLMTAAVLWCGARWYTTRSHRPLLLASLFMGLGMCNHHTIGFAGLAIVLWILILQPSILTKWKLILACIGIFLAGLLPYAYLPIRAAAKTPLNWGDPSTPQRFLEHITRHQYGAFGPMKTAEPQSWSRLTTQFGYIAESVADDLTPWLALAAILGLFVMPFQRKRRGLLLLVILWLICTGGLFALSANYDLDRTSRWAMRVFLIPVPLGLAISLACLLDWLLTRLRPWLSKSAWRERLAPVGLACIAPAILLAANWKSCDYSNYWYAYDHARNMMTCMMDNALVFPSGDHNTFPLCYLLQVEDKRPDILLGDIYGYVSPELYSDRPLDDMDPPETWLVKHARRPVYYATKRASPVTNATFVPAGVLYHLLPNGMPFDGQNLLEQCTYRNLEEPSVLDFGACHILCDYEFFAALHELGRGQPEAGLKHLEKSCEYGHGIRECYNNAGSMLGEFGLSEDAIAYFVLAAELDPHYTRPRWNLFRLQKRLGRYEQARKWLQEVIDADPTDFRAYGEMGFLLNGYLDDPAGAVRYWQESLKLNPGQQQIIEAMTKGE